MYKHGSQDTESSSTQIWDRMALQRRHVSLGGIVLSSSAQPFLACILAAPILPMKFLTGSIYTKTLAILEVRHLHVPPDYPLCSVMHSW